MRINLENNYNLPRIVTRNVASNSIVVGSIKHAPFPLSSREFATRMTWVKTAPDEVVVCAQSLLDENVDYGVNIRSVRAITTVFYEFRRVREDVCSIAQ